MNRLGWVVAIALLSIAATGSIFVDLPPRLVWNASPSVPIGFYVLHPIGDLHLNELVAVDPPATVASFLADNGYVSRGVLILKRVLGLPGQIACRQGLRITVDGVDVGEAQMRDRQGRKLPAWEGCRLLRAGEAFVINPGVPESLDSRYFGPLPTSSIIARAIPLWTDEGGDGHFVWDAGIH